MARPRSRGGTGPPSRCHRLTQRRGLSGPSRQSSPGGIPATAGPRKIRPAAGAPAAHPRKNSPSKPKNTKIGVFSARWANYFAHRTRRHGDVETNDTTAATDAGHRETTITTACPSTATVETNNTSATKRRTKNTHLSPAKATPVSTGPPHRPAKAIAVSTGPPHRPAKAMAVSDNRPPGRQNQADAPWAATTPPPAKFRT